MAEQAVRCSKACGNVAAGSEAFEELHTSVKSANEKSACSTTASKVPHDSAESLDSSLHTYAASADGGIDSTAATYATDASTHGGKHSILF